MSAETTIRARVRKDIKDKAADALDKMGLTLSDAIRIYLVQIAGEGRIPFELRVPNDATRQAIRELAAGDAVTVDNMDDYRKAVYGDDAEDNDC